MEESVLALTWVGKKKGSLAPTRQKLLEIKISDLTANGDCRGGVITLLEWVGNYQRNDGVFVIWLDSGIVRGGVVVSGWWVVAYRVTLWMRSGPSTWMHAV
jgi:hypothetical protein